jgi:hypothetical protein
VGESSRKKLTFDGFLMEMGEAGTRDSEGVFTLAAQKTVERLREQYSADPLLGYIEILQGFQETGALCVELHAREPSQFTFSALYLEPPDLDLVLNDPLSILSASSCLQSGTGLLLLQEEQISWSVTQSRGRENWEFHNESGTFRPVADLNWRVPNPVKSKLGAVWLQLHIRSEKVLPIYTWENLESWGNTYLTREFTNRLAFYAKPLTFRRKNLQCPLPGRLVPNDHWCRSPLGGMGYSWVPLAYQYVAADSETRHSFLSEPFTGLIANKVKLGDSTLSGYASASKPDYVALKGCETVAAAPTVPFKRSWWHRSEQLAVPGFQAFSEALQNPRLEPPLFRSHPQGKPLVCSRIFMLSTALNGLSTLVFLKHGTVLGARHEDLGAPGSLCLIGLNDLSTDLSRRRVRQDERYDALVNMLRGEMELFYNEAAHVLGF